MHSFYILPYMAFNGSISIGSQVFVEITVKTVLDIVVCEVQLTSDVWYFLRAAIVSLGWGLN